MNLRQSIIQQFKQPRGMLGKLAGHIMAKRPSNIERNHWMLEMAALQPKDNVLEIGYGPGLALEEATQKIPDGLVMGIDHSHAMYQQASRRICTAISQSKARLLVGDIQQQPQFDIQFDHIYSANVVMFWENPAAVFRYLKALLRPNGDVITVFMPRNNSASSEDSIQYGEKLLGWLKEAGFFHVNMVIKDFDGLAAVCVTATNSEH